MEKAEPMFASQIIRYKITPFGNIPLTWVTEITHCFSKSYFIDEQKFGPYKFWHHLHRFTEVKEGVLMEDILNYALPLGRLGNLVAGKFVENKVKEIFDHRYTELDKLFNDQTISNSQNEIMF